MLFPLHDGAHGDDQFFERSVLQDVTVDTHTERLAHVFLALMNRERDDPDGW